MHLTRGNFPTIRNITLQIPINGNGTKWMENDDCKYFCSYIIIPSSCDFHQRSRKGFSSLYMCDHVVPYVNYNLSVYTGLSSIGNLSRWPPLLMEGATMSLMAPVLHVPLSQVSWPSFWKQSELLHKQVAMPIGKPISQQALSYYILAY